MCAAEAAAASTPQPVQDDRQRDERDERDVVIADLAGGDGKTIAFTTSFNVTWRNPETGRVNVGTFTAQRPTLGQLGQIAVLKAKMNGGEKLPANVEFMHDMISSLQIILTDFPEWWTPHDFFDARPLREVWDHVRRWVDNFPVKRLG